MARVLPCGLITLLLAVPAFSQRPGKSSTFTAADVHVSPRRSDPVVGGGVLRGERYELRNATMLNLILIAYSLDGGKLIGLPLWLAQPLADKVAGGPDWLNSDRFDIVARAPRDSSPEDLRLMLQALLADRFKLEVHHDKRPVEAYVLKAGPHPLLKKPSDETGSMGCRGQAPQSTEPEAASDRALSCHNFTMAALVSALPQWGSDYFTSVTDLTGLEGPWDFSLRWTPRGQPGSISLLDAVDKQLGLKLEKQKLPTEVVVVDHVNQKPADNPAGTTEKLPAPPSEFEVSDIKPTAPDANFRSLRLQPGGRFEARGMTLKALILYAWDITPDMLAADQKWLDANRFDIIAKAPADTVPGGSVDFDMLRPMLRTLLADRFKLVTHNEDRPVSVYAMSVARRSSNLHKADPANRPDCKSTPPPPGTPVNSPLTAVWACQNMSMTLLADKLQGMAPAYVDHMITDSTGLAGSWDFTLSWTPIGLLQQINRNAGADPSGGLSLSDALDKQLGIKLELQKQVMPVLVVDRIEHAPTDN